MPANKGQRRASMFMLGATLWTVHTCRSSRLLSVLAPGARTGRARRSSSRSSSSTTRASSTASCTSSSRRTMHRCQHPRRMARPCEDHLVLRALIGKPPPLGLRRAHQEPPGRDPPHPLLHALAARADGERRKPAVAILAPLDRPGRGVAVLQRMPRRRSGLGQGGRDGAGEVAPDHALQARRRAGEIFPLGLLEPGYRIVGSSLGSPILSAGLGEMAAGDLVEVLVALDDRALDRARPRPV